VHLVGSYCTSRGRSPLILIPFRMKVSGQLPKPAFLFPTRHRLSQLCRNLEWL